MASKTSELPTPTDEQLRAVVECPACAHEAPHAWYWGDGGKHTCPKCGAEFDGAECGPEPSS